MTTLQNKKIKKLILLTLVSTLIFSLAFTAVDAKAKKYPRSKLLSVSVIHNNSNKATIVSTASKPAGKYKHISYKYYNNSTKKWYVYNVKSTKHQLKVPRGNKNTKWTIAINVVYGNSSNDIAAESPAKTVVVKKKTK